MAVGTLVKLGGNLETPRDSKPSDYPAVGSTGPVGDKEPGEGSLVKLSPGQERPRHTQDSGDNTPSVWGKADWTVGKANEGSTSISCPVSVDLEKGYFVPDVRTKPY